MKSKNIVNFGRKGTTLSLSLLMLIAPALFTRCGGGGGGSTPTENPGDNFGVTFANLTGKAITIDFPEGFDAAEQAALMDRLENIIGRLDTKAGEDEVFKAKINTLLGYGLAIVIEDTEEYGIKVVGGQLFIDTGLLDNMNNRGITDYIIDFINSGTLAKTRHIDNGRATRDTVHMDTQRCLTLKNHSAALCANTLYLR